MTSPGPFRIRSKVWIIDDHNHVVFGLGRLRILEAVKRCGSIKAAAEELRMSYRAMWGRIRATEKRLGQPLLVRNIGGATGGGSELTPLAETLIKKFRRLLILVEAESNELFDEHLSADLLPEKTDFS